MNHGMAVVFVVLIRLDVFQLAGTKADLPPRPSISAWLNWCRPPVLEKAPTQVVPSWLTSGPTPLVSDAVILLKASLQSTSVPSTWMLGCAALKAAASALK